MSDDEFPFRWTTRHPPFGLRRVLPGFKARVVGSIALLTGGIVFIVGYLGVLAIHYPWYTNAAVVVSTLIVVPVALVVMWVLWGLGIGDRVLRDSARDW
jgi:hypothetical protein